MQNHRPGACAPVFEPLPQFYGPDGPAPDEALAADQPPAVAPPAGGRADWRLAAKLIARGYPMHMVAGYLHVGEERLWRNLRRSRRFARRIEEERRRVAEGARFEFDGLRRDLVMMLRQDLQGDRRTMLWLAERLALGQPGAGEPGEKAAPPRPATG